MPQNRILIVEDELKLAEALGDYLVSMGYGVVKVTHLAEAKVSIDTYKPQLILLDWMLPDGSGADFLLKLRQTSDLPVIMLTAKVEENDIIHGFETGADDYVTKPFSMKQLVMRIQAVLRRRPDESEVKLKTSDGQIVVDLSNRQVHFSGQLMALTPSEYNLLCTLLKHPQKVFTREELIFSALGEDYEGVDRTVDTFIKNLRQKMLHSGLKGAYIETVHGVGYKMGACR